MVLITIVQDSINNSRNDLKNVRSLKPQLNNKKTKENGLKPFPQTKKKNKCVQCGTIHSLYVIDMHDKNVINVENQAIELPTAQKIRKREVNRNNKHA